MKRFFCTKCQKMKRVRNYPTSIENVDAVNPTDRVGECNRHSIGYAPRVKQAPVVSKRKAS
jgi:hypothetical protein